MSTPSVHLSGTRQFMAAQSAASAATPAQAPDGDQSAQFDLLFNLHLGDGIPGMDPATSGTATDETTKLGVDMLAAADVATLPPPSAQGSALPDPAALLWNPFAPAGALYRADPAVAPAMNADTGDTETVCDTTPAIGDIPAARSETAGEAVNTLPQDSAVTPASLPASLTASTLQRPLQREAASVGSTVGTLQQAPQGEAASANPTASALPQVPQREYSPARSEATPTDAPVVAEPPLQTVPPAQAASPPPMPTATVRLDVPTSSPAFPDELAGRIAVFVDQKQLSARLEVHPPELGLVDIKIKVNADQIEVDFFATHADARHAIEHAIPRLKELLAEQGLSLGGAHVGTREDSRHFSGNGQHGLPWRDAAPDTAVNPPHDSSDTELVPAAGMRQSLRLVDTFA